MNRDRRTILLSTVVLALAVGVAHDRTSAAAPGSDEPVLELVATAINMSGRGPVDAGRIDITIERWSTPAQRKMLVDTLKEKGPDALLSALQSIQPPAGHISTSTSLAWDVQFAYEVPNESGGRRIIIATDRPMSFWELQSGTRSSDYEFLLAEIRVGANGEGEGRLAPAARVTYFEPTKTVEIENYDQEPIRLRNVRVVGGEGAQAG